MFSPVRRGARLPVTILGLALGVWIVSGPTAFGHGGGGHGGGGHGGGHSGGHHSGSHHSGGYHHSGYHHGGYYYGGYGLGGYGYGGYGYGGYGYGYNNGYYPNSYYSGYSYGYPGYGYGYGSGYSYPSYSYNYGTAQPSQGRYLGIDEQPMVDSGGPGMQVIRVYPGSPAQQAGLQVGDVIHSANGYLTRAHGNLAWIIAQMPPSGELRMNVRTARDGAEHVIVARVP